jgi:hypothetical protein
MKPLSQCRIRAVADSLARTRAGRSSTPACICWVFWVAALCHRSARRVWQALPNVANGSPTFAHVPSLPPRLANPPNAKRPREREAFLAQRVVRGYFLASPNLPRSVFTKRDSFPLAFISRKIAE